jgi:putative transposase
MSSGLPLNPVESALSFSAEVPWPRTEAAKVADAMIEAENRILRNQITGRVRLTDGERKTLAEIGQKLGKQALKEVAKLVKPDIILGWHRQLVAQKFDGSQQRKSPGRPKVDPELEALIVHMAREHRSWGYDRIVGALANLGYTVRAGCEFSGV